MEALFEWFNPALPTELTVVPHNQRAIDFYKRKGFVSNGFVVHEIPTFDKVGLDMGEMKMIRPALLAAK